MGISGRSYTRESKPINSTWRNLHRIWLVNSSWGHSARMQKMPYQKSACIRSSKGQPPSLSRHQQSLNLTRAPLALTVVVFTERFSASDDFFFSRIGGVIPYFAARLS